MSDLERARELAHAALASLERSRSRIDDLNVYPVPDGDTGTNLALTARAVVEAVESSQADDRATLEREITRAALMGARGNSGVILSQIVRGAAEALAAESELDGGVVVEGELDAAAIERQLETLGDSLLVVGDEHAVKAHVHTDDPGRALSVGTAAGSIANVEIADMHRQIAARERRLLSAVPDPAT